MKKIVKTSSSLSKKHQIFAEIFGENIFKTVTSVPDRGYFSLGQSFENLLKIFSPTKDVLPTVWLSHCHSHSAVADLVSLSDKGAGRK
jgi:hypothetical protein